MSKIPHPKNIIFFDKTTFDKHQQDFKQNSEIGAKILKEFNKIALAPVNELNDPSEAINLFYKQLEEDAQNVMNLTGQKLAHLKEIDLSSITKLLDAFKPHLKPPTINEYTQYATTEAEQARLDAFTNLNKAFHDFIKLDPQIRPTDLAKAIPYRAAYDTNGGLRAQPTWIKDGKIRIYG